MKCEILPAYGQEGNLVPMLKVIPETKAEVEWLNDWMLKASLAPGKIVAAGVQPVKYQSDLTRLLVAGLLVFPQPVEMVGIIQNLKEYSHEQN